MAVVQRTGRSSHRVRHGHTYYVRSRHPLVFSNDTACGRGPGVARVFAGFDASRRRGVDTRLQFRGFVRPRDLEKTRPGSPRRCPRAQGMPVDEAPLPFRAEQVFDRRDRYNRPGRNPSGGDSYGSYAARAGGSIYLSASTIAARRGGVPIAVVDARTDTFTRTGYYTHCDAGRLPRRGSPRRVKPIVSWSFGFVQRGGQRVYGWVPTQTLRTPATEPPLQGC